MNIIIDSNYGLANNMIYGVIFQNFKNIILYFYKSLILGKNKWKRININNFHVINN